MKFGQLDNWEDVDFSFPEIPSLTSSILSKLPKYKPSFYFGAPVFADKNYKGTLFPADTKQKDFLNAYAQQFNSLEVAATRYGTPKHAILQKWKDSVPDDFKFSLKFPQVITHRKEINHPDAKQRLEDFLVALDFMGNKNGVAFAVMANYFRPDKLDDLIEFVEFLPKDVPFAIELRAPEWFETESIQNEWHQLFKENNIVPVMTDTPGRRDALSFRLTNENLFVRYVGNFSNPIDSIRIDNWVNRMEELIGLGVRNVWFYAHQPGENRELVVEFFNCLIEKLNVKLGMDLPRLIKYNGFNEKIKRGSRSV